MTCTGASGSRGGDVPVEMIVERMCFALRCSPDEVGIPVELDAGMNNVSYLVDALGERYVFRIPGEGTNLLVNRHAEKASLEIARDLGLDTTYVAMDADEGWKLSRYIPETSKLDYENRAQVAKAMSMLGRLHTSGRETDWSFSFVDDAWRLLGLLEDGGYPTSEELGEIVTLSHSLEGLLADREASGFVLCHNDCYKENILVAGDLIQFIDWEYSAMGDPLFDIGNFVSQGSGYTPDEIPGLLEMYYGRPATAAEVHDCIVVTAFLGCYWYIWAMYKDMLDDPVWEWAARYLSAARMFGSAALDGANTTMGA